MRPKNTIWQSAAWLVAIAGIGICVWLTRGSWQLTDSPDTSSENTDRNITTNYDEENNIVEVNMKARSNLGLVSKPVKFQNYWRTIEIPGEIIDRPGVTDQGITSPLKGVVTQVHAFEGDVVRPGERLFTLRLLSESLQEAQSGLYKAIRETEIIQKEKARIEQLIGNGIVPGKRMIELEQKANRQEVLVDSYQQELLARGLNSEQIGQIKQGKFLATIDVKAPMEAEGLGFDQNNTLGGDTGLDSFFEIQQLMVDLGHQIDAGTPLATLANHQSLYIKGHAFKKEASQIGAAAENGWKVNVEFIDDQPRDWQPIDQQFQIRHLSNATDTGSRTFDFFVPLTNQSRVYEKSGRPFIVWRFRPGQRVRISVPLDEMKDVIVLPAAAVYQKGTESFVFQQNGNQFNRLSVNIIHQDRANFVIENDGSILPGFYLAQNAAASLNRILKSQATGSGRSGSELPPGFHVHADGSVHGAH